MGKENQVIGTHWQQSQGTFIALSKYIDAQKSHSFVPSDLDKRLEQAKHKKFRIIADKAGMDKTTCPTCLKES